GGDGLNPLTNQSGHSVGADHLYDEQAALQPKGLCDVALRNSCGKMPMTRECAPFALIADDDPLVRMSSAEILEEAGFRVLEAESVDQAVRILQANGNGIRLLFTDVQMPPSNRDGFELARTCADAWPDIHILVASGLVRPGDGDLPEGAIFINKPFSADLVYDRLQDLLPTDEQPAPLRQVFK
ncbi:response regulator, partial [Novosphingobium sp. TCA1]|uniref:response regulator n=1 Tax=Novosphingobium sp. TCA1 TaxID=2682474 RepID=UPI001F45339C